MSFTNTRKTEIQLNAFFRQQVVSPYPTGMGLDFLGVTTKAHFPAQAAKVNVPTMYAKSGLLGASRDATPGAAIPMVGNPLCSGIE